MNTTQSLHDYDDVLDLMLRKSSSFGSRWSKTIPDVSFRNKSRLKGNVNHYIQTVMEIPFWECVEKLIECALCGHAAIYPYQESQLVGFKPVNAALLIFQAELFSKEHL
jgi:hypothetical protein